jgi:hypothetical protein
MGRGAQRPHLPTSVLQITRALDLVIIYLGTNELAPFYHLPALGIAVSCASLVRVVRAAECGRDGGTPPALLVCPPPIDSAGPNAANARDVLRYSDEDPIHLDADGPPHTRSGVTAIRAST